VQPGNLFAALPGERTDGHRHLPEAVAARGGGARRDPSPLLTDPRPSSATSRSSGSPMPRRAPCRRRRLAAPRFAPLVVGVTGSIAKTSTKEAIAPSSRTRFATLRSEGNQNNEIGLPLTVLRLGPEHEAAVLEMGMYVGGEIADLAAIGRPSIGVVTAVQGVHLSRIGSIDAIERPRASSSRRSRPAERPSC
jgi:UDP-N-acetylmuramoyl-tripeptide--D-alanyl-D-alanine ligase